MEKLNIDVLIVTRNLKEILPQTIKSLHFYPFRKIIVVSGEKGDLKHKPDWCDVIVYAHKLPLGERRNLGLRFVESEFVIMVDSDIVLTKGYVEKLLEYFEDPKVVAVCGRLFPLSSGNIYSNIKARINEAFNIFHNQIGCGGTLYRSRVIKKVKFSPLHTREDHDINKRLRKLGYKVVFTKETYCFHDFRMSIKLEIKDYAKSQRLYAILCSYIRNVLRPVFFFMPW